jgi:uncharacterized protein YqhQ
MSSPQGSSSLASSSPSPQAFAPTPARPYIGGQALLEGVMMRSPRSFAMVCRRRSGELVVRERPIADERTGARALPFARGVMALVESLKLGSEALKFAQTILEKDFALEEAEEAAKTAAQNGLVDSAKKAGKTALSTLAALSLPVLALASLEPDDAPRPATPSDEVGAEEEGLGRKLASFAAILLPIGLFIAAPQAAANGVNKLFHLGLDIRDAQFQLITGAAKLCIVIGYMALLRMIPDVRRMFQYHGAEHKTISTYEAQEPLTVANARGKTTLHPRCGTTFLVMVAMVSVVVFSIISPFLPHIPGAHGFLENVMLFLMKLPFIPVIAGITFEIQRIFARYCTTGPLRVLLWPGFLVQKVTTIEPDDDQLEVAMAAMRATLFREEEPEAAPADVSEQSFPSYGALMAAPAFARDGASAAAVA